MFLEIKSTTCDLWWDVLTIELPAICCTKATSAQNNAGKLRGQHDRSSVNLGGQIHNLGGQPFFPLTLYIIHKSIHFLICTESETKIFGRFFGILYRCRHWRFQLNGYVTPCVWTIKECRKSDDINIISLKLEQSSWQPVSDFGGSNRENGGHWPLNPHYFERWYKRSPSMWSKMNAKLAHPGELWG